MAEKLGQFNGRVQSWNVGHVGANVTPVCTVLFRLEDGRRYSKQLWLTDKALPSSLATLRLLGWRGESLGALRLDKDREVAITLDQETGQNGKTYTVITWINEARKLRPVTELSESSIDELDAKARDIFAEDVDVSGIDHADDIPF
jgi:hypothetical protein